MQIVVKGFDFGSGPLSFLALILQWYHQYDIKIYDLFYTMGKPHR